MRHLMRAVALGMFLASSAQAQSDAPSSAADLGPTTTLATKENNIAACFDCWDKTNLTACGIPARWTVRHDIGDGVGYTRGFTYLEGLAPLYQSADFDLAFADARIVNFDDWGRWEFNFGAGYRRQADTIDAVLGVNLFYDGRRTDTNFFHQIGVGAEALFDRWEMRCNGYFIVGPHQQLSAEASAAAIVGNQLILDRFRAYEVAMGGFDAEIGALLPVLPKLTPRAFLGFYHYSAANMQSANGIRGRFEAWLADGCSIHFAIQNDALFDTTVSGGLALHFGGRRDRSHPDGRSVEERLGQRVVRDVNVVIGDRTEVDRVKLLFEEKLKSVESAGQTAPPKSPDNDAAPPADASDEAPKLPPGGTAETPPYLSCRPFPGAPGNPSTFPGNHFPPGFHHPCFPGRGLAKGLNKD